MEIIKLTKEKYLVWDKFCLENDTAWFWHTINWQKYILSYISKSRPRKENLSFMIYDQNTLVAIVPLISENNRVEKQEIKEFAYDGWVVPAPAVADDLSTAKRELVYKLIFDRVDRLAKKNKITLAKFGLSPFSFGLENKKQISNYLTQFGYLDISLNTRIIDLRKSKKELWQNLRRNHRRNILKGEGFKINFYTADNITRKIFNDYKMMHHKAAGRQTRPDKTFELMFTWIKNDLAFLAVLEDRNKYVGFEYYSVYKNNVYGFSAANDPEYKHLPVRHFLEWQSILWMKQQKFNFYEIGLDWSNILLHNLPEEKKMNISHFKKGFGGLLVPLFMGEKYYDKKYFLDIYKKRIKKFSEHI